MKFKALLSLLLLTTISYFSIGQKVSFNTVFHSQVSFNENSSDVWGFEKDGIKYAIIGTATKTNVYSLEDIKNPILRYTAPGAQSIWRDIKSYNNHLYVTTDQGTDGLVIIDMNGAPTNISHTNFKPELTVGIESKSLQRCHNLYIDEKGFCYLAGCNISQRGVLIFDLKQDPKAPVYVGAADLTYSHDAFARGDTLYASEINIGKLSIYDVSDRTKPKLLASQATSRNFTHNAWASDDAKYVFTTDEKANGYVDAYDISDLNNIKLLDKFRPLFTENQNVIPHNTHYYNGYLVTSWYTDGLRIVDAHKPDNLIEVAYYDTWSDPSRCHNGFYGCWGVFPFTNSNLVYASDINNGLFVVEVDYKRACYLEGKIKDTDNLPIVNALVEIISSQVNRETSSPTGEYKTGQAQSGNFIAKITHPDYQTKEVSVNLMNGVVTNLDVVLIKKRSFAVDFKMEDKQSNPIVASIFLKDGSTNVSLRTAVDGKINSQLLSSTYELFVSAWGFDNIYNPSFTIGDGQDNKLESKLAKAYVDNFETNQNWFVNSTSGMSGQWVRAIPNETNYTNDVVANPGSDSNDNGKYAYVTGNGLPGAGCDDVDNGVTELISPEMDLTSYNKPALNYDAWFFNAGGASPLNDTLVIKLFNGQKEVVIDKIYGSTNGWKQVREIDIKGFIPVTKEMKLIVEASDQSGNQGHIVEAGFDNFYISDLASSSQDLFYKLESLIISPNPAQDRIVIELPEKINIKNLKMQIFDVNGKLVQFGNMDFHTKQFDVSTLKSGVYVISLEGYQTTKFVKL